MRVGHVLLFLLLAVMVLPAVAGATAYTVVVTVKGPDGTYVEGAKVTLYGADAKAYENVTDANGVAQIEVPANGTYLVKVEAGNYIVIDSVNVEGNTTYVVDASAMHHADLLSTPISVGVRVAYGAFKPTLNLTTNITVYAPSAINVTYPDEVIRLPYKYMFKKIVYNGRETTENTITLDMVKDYNVTAVYEKTFYTSLNFWLAVIFALIIVAAIVVAFVAGGRKTKEIIGEWQKSRMRFVKRRG